MSLQARITALAQAVGTDIKALQARSTVFDNGPPDARATVIGSATGTGFSLLVPVTVAVGDMVIVGYKTEGVITAAQCGDSAGRTYSAAIVQGGNANNAAVFYAVATVQSPALTVTIASPGNEFDKIAVLVVRGLSGTVLNSAGIFVAGEAALNLSSVNVTAPRSFHVLLWAGYRNINVVSLQAPFTVQTQGNGAGALALGTAMRVTPGDTTAVSVVTAGFPDNQALLQVAFGVSPANVVAAEGTLYVDVSGEPGHPYVMHQGSWRALR